MKLIKDLGLVLRPNTKRKRRRGIYECSKCLEHFDLMTETVAAKSSTLCNSCMNKKKFKKHDFVGTRLYQIWGQMRGRCNIKEHYKNIFVCKEWDTFLTFKKWAETHGYSESLSIDRIDNDGNYEPANCRWTTAEIQNQNTRLIRVNNTTGYRCVFFDKRRNTYYAQIMAFGNLVHIGSNKPKKELAQMVNKYIIENKLAQPLNEIPDE